MLMFVIFNSQKLSPTILFYYKYQYSLTITHSFNNINHPKRKRNGKSFLIDVKRIRFEPFFLSLNVLSHETSYLLLSG